MNDYRFNPWLNVIEPFNILDEVHVIPTNSPFTIRLREVPIKESPSSLSIKFNDNTALTEVAANPAAGEFWPDYSTPDEGWNTGTILFNAADAGKTVKVNYNGLGTLVDNKSVKIFTGTINHGGTIPLPDDYLRSDCKYIVWPSGATTQSVNVNQDTGVVSCTYLTKAAGTYTTYHMGTDEYWHIESFTQNNYFNSYAAGGTAGYMCIVTR